MCWCTTLLWVSVSMANPLEIAYDDGSRVVTTNLSASQRGGVLFQPAGSTYPFQVLWVRVWFSTPGTFTAHLLTGAHVGIHDGVDQVTPFSFQATQTVTWDTIDFRSNNVVLSEDFLFAGQWTSVVPQIWGDGAGSGHFWRDNGVGWFEYNAMDPLIRATIETNTGVQIELPPTLIPEGFRLTGVYPNPWNSQTQIILSIPHPELVRIDLWNLCGQRVRTLWEGSMPVGIQRIPLVRKDSYGDGNNLVSGIYFITACGQDGRKSTIRCILIK
jgi:hypothetical protein